MDNPETQVALGSRHITNTNKSKQYTTQKTKKMGNTDLTRKHVMNPVAVSVYFKTSAVLMR